MLESAFQQDCSHERFHLTRFYQHAVCCATVGVYASLMSFHQRYFRPGGVLLEIWVSAVIWISSCLIFWLRFMISDVHSSVTLFVLIKLEHCKSVDWPKIHKFWDNDTMASFACINFSLDLILSSRKRLPNSLGSIPDLFCFVCPWIKKEKVLFVI